MQTCRKLSVITLSLFFCFELSANASKDIAEAFTRDFTRSWYCSEVFLGAVTASLIRLSRGDSLLTPTWKHYPSYKVDALGVKVSKEKTLETLDKNDLRFAALRAEHSFLQKNLLQLHAALSTNKDFQKFNRDDQNSILERLLSSNMELAVQDKGKIFAWNFEIFNTARSIRLFVPPSDGSSDSPFNLYAEACSEAEITKLKNKKELKFLWTLSDTPAWRDMEILFKDLE